MLLGEMVQSNQKTVFYAVFAFLGAIWAPPNRPKKVPKGLQVGEMYGPMSKLENKLLTKSSGPFFWDKWSKTTGKLFLFMLLLFFWANWAPPNQTKKVSKGLQVGGMYGPSLKISP
jgi:hypothetical protein